MCRYAPPNTETMRVRRWFVSDIDGKEHLVAQGNESRPGAFNYGINGRFRDYLPFHNLACMRDVESWICETFGFREVDMPATETENKDHEIGKQFGAVSMKQVCVDLCVICLHQAEQYNVAPGIKHYRHQE